MRPYFEKNIAEKKDRFKELEHTAKVSAELNTIIPAALHGKIDTLFIAERAGKYLLNGAGGIAHLPAGRRRLFYGFRGHAGEKCTYERIVQILRITVKNGSFTTGITYERIIKPGESLPNRN